MLHPDIPVLLQRFMKKGYVTARIRPSFEGVTISPSSFIESLNVIAGKGVAKVYHDFGRRALGVDSSSYRDLSH